MKVDPEKMVKDLTAKYKVPQKLVQAVMGNSVLVLMLSIILRQGEDKTLSKMKVDTILIEYAQRWLTIGDLLDIDPTRMTALVVDCMNSSSDAMGDLSVELKEELMSKLKFSHKES